MTLAEWRADRIVAQVLDAARAAIDETTAAAAEVARETVNVDTGYLRDHIAARPAEVRGDAVTGSFGVYDGDPEYAVYQEFIPPPRGKAYLRPAADREFPRLRERLARRRGAR